MSPLKADAVKDFPEAETREEFYAESVSLHSLGSAIRESECATPGNAVVEI